jgi:hypothetical protein
MNSSRSRQKRTKNSRADFIASPSVFRSFDAVAVVARRQEPGKPADVLTEEQLKEVRYNLAHLSPFHVEKFYTDCYMEAAPEKKPSPRVMQKLITAWKLLHGWEWPV